MRKIAEIRSFLPGSAGPAAVPPRPMAAATLAAVAFAMVLFMALPVVLFGALGATPAVAQSRALPEADSRAAPPRSSDASPVRDESYRVGARDLLSIEVFEEPELGGELRVDEEGAIRLPLVGEIQVAGLSIAAVTELLEERLEERFLQRASVSVRVLEFRARPISIIGAVREPGDLDLAGRLTLIEALTRAGGLAPNAGDVVYVLRRAANGLTDQVAVPVQGLLIDADPDWNIPIFANDLINVPTAVEITVYCLGQVERPGALAFRNTERITLLTALARAGGLTDRASRRILIRRQGPDGEREIVVDYRDVVGGEEPDPPLRAGDVVIVKESFF